MFTELRNSQVKMLYLQCTIDDNDALANEPASEIPTSIQSKCNYVPVFVGKTTC